MVICMTRQGVSTVQNPWGHNVNTPVYMVQKILNFHSIVIVKVVTVGLDVILNVQIKVFVTMVIAPVMRVSKEFSARNQIVQVSNVKNHNVVVVVNHCLKSLFGTKGRGP